VAGTITSRGSNTFRDADVTGAVATDRLGVTAEEFFATTVAVGATGLVAGVAADNGGPTWTVALLQTALNPAVDAADPALAPALDQPGFERDASPDLGAFELDAGPPVPPVLIADDDALLARIGDVLDAIVNATRIARAATPAEAAGAESSGRTLALADLLDDADGARDPAGGDAGTGVPAGIAAVAGEPALDSLLVEPPAA